MFAGSAPPDIGSGSTRRRFMSSCSMVSTWKLIISRLVAGQKLKKNKNEKRENIVQIIPILVERIRGW